MSPISKPNINVKDLKWRLQLKPLEHFAHTTQVQTFDPQPQRCSLAKILLPDGFRGSHVCLKTQFCTISYLIRLKYSIILQIYTKKSDLFDI